jgi:hypothetical protein
MGQTAERHNEGNGRFWQFCERAYKESANFIRDVV